MTRYRIEPLAKQGRATFASGSEELDRYLRERATQDVRRRIASCFVAIDEGGSIAGFYTIAATSLVFDLLPADRAKRLPRYPSIPAVLLGRLAIDLAHQGQRLGGALLADALLRASRAEVMAYAMIVEAKNERAADFYEHLGFERLTDDRRKLIRSL